MSDAVILAKVEDIQVKKVPSELRPGKQDIVSDIRVSVEKYLHNPNHLTQSEIVIRTIGGKIGNEEMIASEAPHFEKGQRAVVFIQQAKDGVFTVFGLVRGKYTINPDGTVGDDEEEKNFTKEVFGKEMKDVELVSQLQE